MSRRRLLVATAAVALVAVYITTGRTGIRVDGPLVAQHQGWFQGSGNDAIVGGTLRYDHGCLLLDEDAVLWPDGAEWDENEQTVDLGDSGLAHLGDGVSGGGGVFGGPEDRHGGWADSDLVRAVSDCLADDA